MGDASGRTGAGGPADAIIVAAGASLRMGGADKLLATIGDRPLLAHAVDALASSPAVRSIVIVTTADRRQVLEGGGWVPGDRTTFVDGGDRRQDSVRAGFRALEETVPDPDGSRVVLVHVGARPFVPATLVAEVVAATERHGAAIVGGEGPVVAVENESISGIAKHDDIGVARVRLDRKGASVACGNGSTAAMRLEAALA